MTASAQAFGSDRTDHKANVSPMRSATSNQFSNCGGMVTDLEAIVKVNRVLRQFCFTHGTPLLQFGLYRPPSAAQLEQVGSYQASAPIHAGDGPNEWANSALLG